jgi:hypothetical protein
MTFRDFWPSRVGGWLMLSGLVAAFVMWGAYDYGGTPDMTWRLWVAAMIPLAAVVVGSVISIRATMKEIRSRDA